MAGYGRPVTLATHGVEAGESEVQKCLDNRASCRPVAGQLSGDSVSKQKVKRGLGI